MQWKQWLNKWGMSSLKLNLGFLESEWTPKPADQDAAWDLYVELLTRITTQPLSADHGVEQAALDSVYALFGLTREAIKRHGRGCTEFAKLAIVILNQIVRPFTAKWHRLSESGAFAHPESCQQFRSELAQLQSVLRTYTKMLADLAGVEDMSDLENVESR